VTTVRLDVWLDVACLCRTRSEAQKMCTLGKVSVNGATAKQNRLLRIGDELVIQRPLGRRQLLTVVGLADSHIAKADARQLYDDRTPPPTPEEIAARRAERLFRAATTPKGRPGRDQRRTLRRLKSGGFES
jgi:ribosome-associated heat shock protein Hsp15